MHLIRRLNGQKRKSLTDEQPSLMHASTFFAKTASLDNVSIGAASDYGRSSRRVNLSVPLHYTSMHYSQQLHKGAALTLTFHDPTLLRNGRPYMRGIMLILR